jgi:hypothetical protein
MDGIWSGERATEPLRQAELSRHRLLTINLDAGALNARDASSYGASDPNTIVAATARGVEGAPHFIMSPETPDGRPTLGFEFSLVSLGLGADGAQPGVGGFTVTVWELIASSQNVRGEIVPAWSAFEPLTGVGYNQSFRSFDCNATALRFQISNFDPVPAGRSIMIAFCEL